jgi:hypothetical protein
MDDLERRLRVALASIGENVRVRDALLSRTRRRAARLRWRRRAVAAAVITGVIGVASVAAGQAGKERVTTPLTTPSRPTESTSTSSTTTTEPGAPPSTVAAPESPAPGEETPSEETEPTSPTTEPPLQCGPPPVIDDWVPAVVEMLPTGEIRVSIGNRPTGPANETWVYVWDDGITEPTRTFTPDEFGMHWYELHWELNGIPRSCPQRVEIEVGPASAATTTTPALDV